MVVIISPIAFYFFWDTLLFYEFILFYWVTSSVLEKKHIVYLMEITIFRVIDWLKY